MCGLFGVIGPGIQRPDLSVFRDLMVFSSVRGVDGTGFYVGNSRTNKGTLAKLGGDSIYFLETLNKTEESELDKTSNNFFIGHTRFRTRGDGGIKGSQPFDTGGIVGTHNGTIDHDFEGYASDSEKFLTNIAFAGPKAAVSKLTNKDAFAVVAYDKSKRDILIMRNDKRTLFFALNQTREVLYYASEAGFLYAALWRNGIATPDGVSSFHPNVAYYFNPSDIIRKKKLYYRYLELPPPAVKETPVTTQTQESPTEKTNDSPPFDV